MKKQPFWKSNTECGSATLCQQKGFSVLHLSFFYSAFDPDEGTVRNVEHKRFSLLTVSQNCA